ncbi:MAG: hypothetical protein V9H26_09555 [Verrucomicrobiota bacterium]
MAPTPRAESGPNFNFYMGKNTPERKDYIMDSLVVPVEEWAIGRRELTGLRCFRTLRDAFMS